MMAILWNFSIKEGSKRQHFMNSVRYRGVDLTKSSCSRVPHLYNLVNRQEFVVNIRLNIIERDASCSFYFDFWTKHNRHER